MAYKGKVSNGSYELVPVGNHPSVLVGVVDLGTHRESYMGGPEKEVGKVLLVWEARVEDDSRLHIGHVFNVPLNRHGEPVFGQKSGMRMFLENWRGKAYGDDEDVDPEAFINQGCLLNVGHKVTSQNRSVHQVKSASVLPRGMKAFTPDVRPVMYDASSDDPAPDCDWLPLVYGRKIVDILEECLQWGGDGRRVQSSANGKTAPAAVKLAEQTVTADVDPF